MTGLWLALGFLSRVPVVRVEFTATALRRSLFWFPAVGVLLGLLWTGVHWAAQSWAPGLGAFMLVFCGVLFTGALHLDGLADTFDGLSAAGAGSEKGLAAMKDSRIGAHGAVALVVALLGKYAAFAALEPAASASVCLTAAIVPRLCCAVALAVARPARPNGLGAAFARAGDVNDELPDQGVTPGLVVALLGVSWLGAAFAAAGLEGVRWITIVVLFTLGVGVAGAAVWRFLRAFGGVTGDTHGALIELCETVLLLAGAALGRSLK